MLRLIKSLVEAYHEARFRAKVVNLVGEEEANALLAERRNPG
jgi:hypothetical protein